MADKPAVMPTAVVAEAYQSRYTIEWVNGPMPLGTNLYAGPKVVKAWAEEVPEDSACDASVTVTYVHARGDVTRMSKYQALIDALKAGPVEYACHVDGCVDRTCAFDEGHEVHECGVAQRLSAKGLCKLDCDEWKPIKAAKPTIEVKAEDLRALLADLERAEKDAERYRWLRDKGRYNDFRVTQEKPGWLATHSASTLDAAIDAALAQMAGG